MLYDNYHNDKEKASIIHEMYIIKRMSFYDIANNLGTYANRIRRDAKKFNIPIRDKSSAQKNALTTGKHSHPTKGKQRPNDTKTKIGKGVMENWENLSEKEKQKRKIVSKQLWEKLSDDEKEARLKAANIAVRKTSKVGSKLEHFLLENLTQDGYKVEFHKEQNLSNTKLQIDLYLPTMGIAIEVDGPSHFEPVWGDDSLQKNKKSDKKKSGLIIGKGLKLIRLRQTHDFSKTRANLLYEKLQQIIKDKTSFDNTKIITIED